MTSPYLITDEEIRALAKAIRGYEDIDDALAKAREAGITDELILKHLDAAMEREFTRRLNNARAH